MRFNMPKLFINAILYPVLVSCIAVSAFAESASAINSLDESDTQVKSANLTAEQQYKLANEYYEKGLNSNVELDKQKLFEQYIYWLQKSASNGNASAQVDLGTYYESGFIVEQDYTKALNLYQQSAAQNNEIAMHNIGALYLNGLGVKRDHQLAMQQFQKAADMGYLFSNCLLGVMYRKGYGTKTDYAKAFTLLKKGVESGDPYYQINLASMYAYKLDRSYNIFDEDNFDQAVYDENLYNTRKYLLLAEAQGELHASYLLAILESIKKDNTEKDRQNAIKKLEQLTEQGYLPAQVWLAKYLAFGGGERDEVRAEALLNDAIDKGSTEAMVLLANFLGRGFFNIEQDQKRALALYQQAIEAGDDSAFWGLETLKLNMEETDSN